MDLILFQKEPTFKSTFVRLIGQHDSIFIFLCQACVVLFNAACDGYSYGSEHLLMFCYLPWVLYVFNRLMDDKAVLLRKSWLPYLVTIGTVLMLGLYLHANLLTKDKIHVSERKYPLFD